MVSNNQDFKPLAFKGRGVIKKTPFNFNKNFLPTSVLKKVKEQKLLGDLTEDFVAFESKRKEFNLTGEKTVYKSFEDKEFAGARKKLIKLKNSMQKTLFDNGFINKNGNWKVEGIPFKKMEINSSKHKRSVIPDHIDGSFEINMLGGEVKTLDAAFINVKRKAEVTEKITGNQVTVRNHKGAPIKARELYSKGQSIINGEGGTLHLSEKSVATNVKFKKVISSDNSHIERSQIGVYKANGHSTSSNNIISETAELNSKASMENSRVARLEMNDSSKAKKIRFDSVKGTDKASLVDSKGREALFLNSSKFRRIDVKGSLNAMPVKEFLNKISLVTAKTKKFIKLSSATQKRYLNYLGYKAGRNFKIKKLVKKPA